MHFLQRGIQIFIFYKEGFISLRSTTDLQEDPMLLQRLIFTKKSINVSQEILLVGEERL